MNASLIPMVTPQFGPFLLKRQVPVFSLSGILENSQS